MTTSSTNGFCSSRFMELAHSMLDRDIDKNNSAMLLEHSAGCEKCREALELLKNSEAILRRATKVSALPAKFATASFLRQYTEQSSIEPSVNGPVKSMPLNTMPVKTFFLAIAGIGAAAIISTVMLTSLNENSKDAVNTGKEPAAQKQSTKNTSSPAGNTPQKFPESTVKKNEPVNNILTDINNNEAGKKETMKKEPVENSRESSETKLVPVKKSTVAKPDNNDNMFYNDMMKRNRNIKNPGSRPADTAE